MDFEQDPEYRGRLVTTARERYANVLIDALESVAASQMPAALDLELCDRIERVLGIKPTTRTKRSKGPLTIPDIIEAVAKRWGVPPEELVGERRTQPETTARHVAMRMCRELLGATYSEIGHAFNRDHATVIHACEVTEGMALGDLREELLEASG